LKENELGVLQKRFRDKRTLNDIGKEYGLSGERIRQIEYTALSKLRKPELKTLIIAAPYIEMLQERIKNQNLERERDSAIKAMEEFNNKLAEVKSTHKEFGIVDIMSTPIEELGLSYRSFNRLYLSRKKTIGDVAIMSKQELIKVKNLGIESATEIMSVLETYGITLRDDLRGIKNVKNIL